MSEFTATVFIFIKKEVLNPEEKQTAEALKKLDFANVSNIKMGKCHIISLVAINREEVEEVVNQMCRKLLVNPVTETFEINKILETKTK